MTVNIRPPPLPTTIAENYTLGKVDGWFNLSQAYSTVQFRKNRAFGCVQSCLVFVPDCQFHELLVVMDELSRNISVYGVCVPNDVGMSYART